VNTNLAFHMEISCDRWTCLHYNPTE